MKKISKLLTVILICGFCQPALSALINEMQACQGLLIYIDNKLNTAPPEYPSDKVMKVRKGLKQYNEYSQDQIVAPGLLQFNAGDAAKAKAMQLQVDTYKTSILKGMQARDSSSKITSNHAISINNCAKKAVPSGQALENLKFAINTLIELAQLN